MKCWETMGNHQWKLFTINNSNFLPAVDYHSTFSKVKKAENQSVYSWVTCCKTIVAEYRLTKKIILYTGTNLASDNSKTFARSWTLKSHIIIIWSAKQQITRGMHKIYQKLYAKCFDTKADVNLALYRSYQHYWDQSYHILPQYSSTDQLEL